MSPIEYAQLMERRVNKILSTNTPFEKAVKNIVALQAKRIFIDGQNTSGGNIGQYSTKPMYVNPDYAPRKGKTKKLQGLIPTVGKTGEHLFADGSEHKTTYLPGGYKELRNRIGRRIDKVNFTFTNDLLSDFCNSELPGKATPHKVSNTEYQTKFKRPHNAEKRASLEKKYGTVFNLQVKERAAFFKTLDFNFRKALIDG